jgi:hypothetical protein
MQFRTELIMYRRWRSILYAEKGQSIVFDRRVPQASFCQREEPWPITVA